MKHEVQSHHPQDARTEGTNVGPPSCIAELLNPPKGSTPGLFVLQATQLLLCVCGGEGECVVVCVCGGGGATIVRFSITCS